ncbi:hypothetical protein RQP46_005039 [Phenoliferia psychrophenolica]
MGVTTSRTTEIRDAAYASAVMNARMGIQTVGCAEGVTSCNSDGVARTCLPGLVLSIVPGSDLPTCIPCGAEDRYHGRCRARPSVDVDEPALVAPVPAPLQFQLGSWK